MRVGVVLRGATIDLNYQSRPPIVVTKRERQCLDDLVFVLRAGRFFGLAPP